MHSQPNIVHKIWIFWRHWPRVVGATKTGKEREVKNGATKALWQHGIKVSWHLAKVLQLVWFFFFHCHYEERLFNLWLLCMDCCFHAEKNYLSPVSAIIEQSFNRTMAWRQHNLACSAMAFWNIGILLTLSLCPSHGFLYCCCVVFVWRLVAEVLFA